MPTASSVHCGKQNKDPLKMSMPWYQEPMNVLPYVAKGIWRSDYDYKSWYAEIFMDSLVGPNHSTWEWLSAHSQQEIDISGL